MQAPNSCSSSSSSSSSSLHSCEPWRMAFPRRLLVIVAVLAQVAQSLALESNETLLLSKRTVLNARRHGAICADHSPGVYYLHQHPGSTRWVIFFESGGVCSNDVQCRTRYLQEPYLMSSMNYPDTVTGADLLDADESLFAGFNRVLVPYCSGDLFLGQNVPDETVVFNQSNASTYAFGGKFIARQVMLELRSASDQNTGVLGLDLATDLVMAGSSAGGLGSLNIIRYVRNNIVPRSTRISALVDSSWFIDFQDTARILFSDAMVNRTAMERHYRACMKRDGPSPCCVSCSCMVDRIVPTVKNIANAANNISTTLVSDLVSQNSTDDDDGLEQQNVIEATSMENVNILLLASRYDIFMLGNALAKLKEEGRLGKAGTTKVESIVARATEAIDGYGGIMSATIKRSAATNVKFSYVETACAQHLYFATSSLWTNRSLHGKNADRTYNLGSLIFSTQVKSGTWKQVQVDDKTLYEHVSHWYNNVVMGSDPAMHVADTCSGILCNKKCTDKIFVKYDTSVVFYSKWRWSIAAVCVAMLVFCFATRQRLRLQGYLTNRLLTRYLQRDEMDSPGTSLYCLPACPERFRMSIACHCLNFIVPIASSSKLPESTLLSDTTIREVDGGENDGSGISENGSDNLDAPEELLTGKVANGEVHNTATDTSEDLIFRRNDNIRVSSRKRRSSLIMTRSEFDERQRKFFQKKADQYFPDEVDDAHANNNGDVGTVAGSVFDSSPPEYSVTNVDSAVNNLPSLFSPPLPDGACRGSVRPNGFPSREERKSTLISHMSSQGLKPRLKRRKAKEQVKLILNNVTTYFNAGELVAVMGPSGSGKTTFMDLITGRKLSDNVTGDIIVNGRYMSDLSEWYKQNTGYVLQLASPFYDELSVKENLLYCAMMRVPGNTCGEDLCERVELVMREVGLYEAADTIVGGSMGGGLSGGQKRRLSVAIQLIRMPNVLFLDEPTSGLDANSSLELLKMLHVVAKGGRLVVMTIHQPRLEIYHMFDSILFMCAGKIAFYGSPTRAPEFFLEALEGMPRKQLADDDDDPNPADLIMDLLNSRENQHAIISHYQQSTEPSAVEQAVLDHMADAQSGGRGPLPVSDESGGSTWMHLVAMEGRSNRVDWQTKFYLPFVITIFGLIMGLAYLRQWEGLLLVAAFNIIIGAPFLFITPSFVQQIIGRSLHVFRLEQGDGVCSAPVYTLHMHTHALADTLLPLTTMSVAVCYLTFGLMDFESFFLITVIILMTTAVCLSIVLFTSCAFTSHAVLVSHLICAYCTFLQGFLIFVGNLPVFVRWLVYTNPYYWAFSGTIKVLLGDKQLVCSESSPLRCLPKEGNAVLTTFGFQDSDPFLSLLVLFLMNIFFLVLATMSLTTKAEMLGIVYRYTSAVKRCFQPAWEQSKTPDIQLESTDSDTTKDNSVDIADVEAGLAKPPVSNTPDVFDASEPGEGVEVPEQARRAAYNRSQSVPLKSTSSDYVRRRRPSIATLQEENEPHAVLGGTDWVSGHDLFKVTKRLAKNSMRPGQQGDSGTSSNVTGRPSSGASSVFNQPAAPAQTRAESRPNSSTPGVFSASPQTPRGARFREQTTPGPLSAATQQDSQTSSKFQFPGSQVDGSDAAIELLQDTISETRSRKVDSREKRECLAKMARRRRQKILSANMALRSMEPSQIVSGESSQMGTPSPMQDELRLVYSRRVPGQSSMSLRSVTTPTSERSGLYVQTPVHRRGRPSMQSAPTTPQFGTPQYGTPGGSSAGHVFYRGQESSDQTTSGPVPEQKTQRPKSLAFARSKDSSSLPGTPQKQLSSHPLMETPRSGLLSRRSKDTTPQPSADSRRTAATNHSQTTPDAAGASRKQARPEQRIVDALRHSGHQSSSLSSGQSSGLSLGGSDSGSVSRPTFSSTSSGECHDVLAQASAAAAATLPSPLVRGGKLRTKPAEMSDLSQEQVTSMDTPSMSSPEKSVSADDELSSSGGGGLSSRRQLPGKLRLDSGSESASNSVRFYQHASVQESSDEQESPDAQTPGKSKGHPRLQRRRSCHSRVESTSEFPADSILSPINEASPTPSQSSMKRTRSADDLMQATSASESSGGGQVLKGILRRDGKFSRASGDSTPGSARPKSGVVFTDFASPSSNRTPTTQCPGKSRKSSVSIALSSQRASHSAPSTPSGHLLLEHSLPPPSYSSMTSTGSAAACQAAANTLTSAGDLITSSSARSIRAGTWIASTRYDPIMETSMENDSSLSPVSLQTSFQPVARTTAGQQRGECLDEQDGYASDLETEV